LWVIQIANIAWTLFRNSKVEAYSPSGEQTFILLLFSYIGLILITVISGVMKIMLICA
jgi:hypothetical protein